MQLIICSARPLEQVTEFINHIQNCDKNFEKTKFKNIMTSKDFFKQLTEFDKKIKECSQKLSTYKDSDKIEKLKKRLKHAKKEKKDFINNIDVLANLNSGEKYLLTQILNRQNKMICVSGERITDCFALNEADVGFTLFNDGANGVDSNVDFNDDDMCRLQPEPTSDIVRKTSDIVLKDYSLIIDCMQYGRNIFENIRKFVQYQMACALNLVIFVALGSFIHKDSPMSPP